jgi:hypothetical protein
LRPPRKYQPNKIGATAPAEHQDRCLDGSGPLICLVVISVMHQGAERGSYVTVWICEKSTSNAFNFLRRQVAGELTAEYSIVLFHDFSPFITKLVMFQLCSRLWQRG